MIILGNRVFTLMRTFETDEKLWNYLQALANLKPWMAMKNGHDKWRFAYYPHHMLKDFKLEMMGHENFRDLARQSCEQQQNMIVIYQGTPKPALLPGVP